MVFNKKIQNSLNRTFLTTKFQDHAHTNGSKWHFSISKCISKPFYGVMRSLKFLNCEQYLIEWGIVNYFSVEDDSTFTLSLEITTTS